MIKKLLLLTTLVSSSHLLFSQTLFTYGNKSVNKSEFLKAYYKNPTVDEHNNKKALKEYLDLYINYKLKVQAAYNEKLNEQPSLQATFQEPQSQQWEQGSRTSLPLESG